MVGLDHDLLGLQILRSCGAMNCLVRHSSKSWMLFGIVLMVAVSACGEEPRRYREKSSGGIVWEPPVPGSYVMTFARGEARILLEKEEEATDPPSGRYQLCVGHRVESIEGGELGGFTMEIYSNFSSRFVMFCDIAEPLYLWNSNLVGSTVVARKQVDGEWEYSRSPEGDADAVERAFAERMRAAVFGLWPKARIVPGDEWTPTSEEARALLVLFPTAEVSVKFAEMKCREGDMDGEYIVDVALKVVARDSEKFGSRVVTMDATGTITVSNDGKLTRRELDIISSEGGEALATGSHTVISTVVGP